MPFCVGSFQMGVSCSHTKLAADLFHIYTLLNPSPLVAFRQGKKSLWQIWESRWAFLKNLSAPHLCVCEYVCVCVSWFKPGLHVKRPPKKRPEKRPKEVERLNVKHDKQRCKFLSLIENFFLSFLSVHLLFWTVCKIFGRNGFAFLKNYVCPWRVRLYVCVCFSKFQSSGANLQASSSFRL